MYVAQRGGVALELIRAKMRAGGEVELHLERFYLRAMLAANERPGRGDTDVADELSAREREVDEAIADLHGDLPGIALGRALDLSVDEQDFLWAAVAMAIDPRVAPHTQFLWGNEARQGTTLALYSFVAGLDGPRSRRLALALDKPSHPLRRHRLLRVVPADALPACRAFTVPQRVVQHLLGGDEPDELLTHMGGVVPVPVEAHLDSKQRFALRRMELALGAGDTALVVEGSAGTGRRTAAALAARRSAPVVALDMAQVPPGSLGAALDALVRECFLRRAVPLVANVDALPIDGDGAQVVARALDDVRGPVVITARPGMDLATHRTVVRVRWPTPDTDTRRTLWASALGDDAPALAAALDDVSLRYRLGAGSIARAVAAARVHAQARDGTIVAADLIDGVRSGIAERLEGLAQRVELGQTWDDLVLPPDTMEEVRALVARARHAHEVYERWGFRGKMPRGTGIAALFSGPPGTGKSMVAAIIARELDLDLYQVDLSQVVSKWVGETEKQLARIFDAADAGHALLLFDEADALFAKRTEVRSAVDRYANLEVNFLLQRIEAFSGFTILTTNMETGIDPAVRRRLAAHIAFWRPDAEERASLWRRLIARDAPIDGTLDFERLARLYPDMSGAHIRNAVVAAAFLAAAEGTGIAQEHLERAGRAEYRSMGRVLQAKV